jgi:LmeA-like phospholipid-binding
MTTMTNPARPRTDLKRRRSRTVRRLVIALVVLVGLLVAADFGAAAIFEHEVSKRARQEFGLQDDPSVQVGGFSFLLQAFSGEYDHVTVDAAGVPVQDTLHDLEVHADLYGVQAPLGDLISGNVKSVPVREVEGQVKVKASDVNRVISQNENEVVKTITSVSIDPVSEATVADANAKPQPEQTEKKDSTTAGTRLCLTLDIAGQSTNLCVFGIISLVGGKINFSAKRLEVRNGLTTGTLAGTIQTQILRLLSFTLDPGVLPFKVTPTAVTVEQGALSMKGKASNVLLGGGNG